MVALIGVKSRQCNAVLNGGFTRLAPGSEVRFTEVEGDKGPQASTVHLLGKTHGLPA